VFDVANLYPVPVYHSVGVKLRMPDGLLKIDEGRDRVLRRLRHVRAVAEHQSRSLLLKIDTVHIFSMVSSMQGV